MLTIKEGKTMKINLEENIPTTTLRLSIHSNERSNLRLVHGPAGSTATCGFCKV